VITRLQPSWKFKTSRKVTGHLRTQRRKEKAAVPGEIMHVGASVLCAHGGQAQPTVSDSRVRVSGQPIVTMTPPYSVAGCPFTTPAGNPLPCVTAQWTTAATRVRASGQPVLLRDSQATTIPNGVPLTVVATQIRVKGI
jgi:hypothetical protein